MMRTLHRLKFVFFLLTLTCIGQMQAQECEQFGVVSRGFLLGKFSCEVLIISSDGLTVFEPTALPAEFTPGSFIQFSYETLDSVACAADVPLIHITCIQPLFAEEDSLLADCNFEIATTPLDSLEGTVFQLEVFNPTDFGPYHPQSVVWYEYETGKVLGNEAIIEYSLSDNSSPVVNICADISVTALDTNICQSTLCTTIVPESIFPSIEACQALFIYQPKDPLGANGIVDFYNLSFGNYDQIVWDFGDGQTAASTDLTLTHTYAQPGLYEVCLSIESDSGACTSNFCLPVYTVGGSEICLYNDCVFPGDANKDGSVNIFDVLNLGLGFNATGTARPNAVITPILQAAFNWDFNTFFNLNFKHIDCNGDGQIDALDFTAIDANYQSITENKTLSEIADAPAVTLAFLTDTLFVNPNQSIVTVPAQLNVGTASQPIDHFYGLALAFDYNTKAVNDINYTYESTSFAGPNSTILAKDKFLEVDQQYAVAITRTNQIGVSGSGEIATVSFILDMDLIEGRNQILEIDITDIYTVDSSGVEIPVSVPNDTTSIVIVLDENVSVSTDDQLPKSQFQVYPNPAKEVLVIDLSAQLVLKNSQVQIFNTLGQNVLQQVLGKNQSTLDISNLESGVYWVKIYTEKGIGVQEIFIE